MRGSAQRTYKIRMDGDWTLEDLYRFPRAFEQVYYMAYSLRIGEDSSLRDRLDQAYRAYPWQGGFSAVNFYDQLKYALPKQERPRIVSIQYASPGWLELSVAAVTIAVAVRQFVNAVAAAIREGDSTYTHIVKGLTDRKLLRLDAKRKHLEFRRAELEYIEYCADTTARLLGMPDAAELHARTGHPYRSLKILLSLYRRVRALADFQDKGKAAFK